MKAKVFVFNSDFVDADQMAEELQEFLSSDELYKLISLTQSSASKNYPGELEKFFCETVVTILYQAPPPEPNYLDDGGGGVKILEL